MEPLYRSFCFIDVVKWGNSIRIGEIEKPSVLFIVEIFTLKPILRTW